MSAQDEIGSRNRLIHGLVGGDATNHRLYNTNASFKASIDTLANMLPPMIAGLATYCETTERERQAVEQMMRQGRVIPPALRYKCDFGQCGRNRTDKVLAVQIDGRTIVPCEYHLDIIAGNLKRDVDYRIDHDRDVLELTLIPRDKFPETTDG